MKANELKEKFVKEECREYVGVIRIFPVEANEGPSGDWVHIHDDEEIPEEDDGSTIALHPRIELMKKEESK